MTWKHRGIFVTSNFHFIDIKPTIDKSQVNSIKEAIFARAREKANALAEEKNESYTTQAQNDVMNTARESLNIPEVNPFNQFIKSINNGVSTNNNNPVTAENKAEVAPAEKNEPPQREVKHNIESVNNSNYTNSVRNETMSAARSQFSQGRSLADTLNFLNTQAAISMAKSVQQKRNPFAG